MIGFLILTSCTKDKKETKILEKKEIEAPLNYLPFTDIALNDLSAFKPTGANWEVVGDVVVDIDKEKSLNKEVGIGILLNNNNQKKNKHIFSTFEHGDIELELDVMMPVKSNSGIYFQGRYEIQLFDSWGIKNPEYNDIGGIYQRWDKNAKKKKEDMKATLQKQMPLKLPAYGNT